MKTAGLYVAETLSFAQLVLYANVLQNGYHHHSRFIVLYGALFLTELGEYVTHRIRRHRAEDSNEWDAAHAPARARFELFGRRRIENEDC